MLVRLLYASRTVAATSAAELDGILEQARKNNEAQRINALLCVSFDYFIQLLSGGRSYV